jgi:hypothetical protein
MRGGAAYRFTLLSRAGSGLLALVVSCAMLVAGCGSSHKPGESRTTGRSSQPGTARSTAAAASTAAVDADRDNDGGEPDEDPRDLLRHLGRPAPAPVRTAVTALLKRYYAAMLAGDTAKTCAMLYSPLAEAAGEDYGVPGGGPRYLLGAQSCRQIMARLSAHFHLQLSAEVPKLKVGHVLLRKGQSRQATAVLDFGPSLPERSVGVIEERRAWKLDGLLDGELP